MPIVTVIIPTYNRGYVVHRAINSILNQSFSDFEILVVDDGSTDDTCKVADSFKDNRIRYIYKPNGGVSSARNAGMAQATGKYIAFLDSDDTWPPDFLKVMTKKLEQNQEYGLAYTSTTVINDEKFKNGQPLHITKRYVSGSITKELFKNSIVWPMAVLIRRDILNDFGFDEALKNSDDNDAFLRLSLRTKFLFVSDIIVSRYSSPDAHSKAAIVTGSCNRARSLERFYFKLSGDKVVPRKFAFKKISSVYRRAAERHRKNGYIKASSILYKTAISYNPLDWRLYVGLCKSLLANNSKDKDPDWSMPEPLGEPLCHLLQNK